MKPCLDLEVELATKHLDPLNVNLLGINNKQNIRVLWRGKNCRMELLVCDIYQLPCVIWYQECVHRENIWLLYTLRFQVTVKCKYELIFFQNTDECVSKTKKTSETKWYRKRSYEGDIVALTCCVSLWKQCHQFLSGAREALRKPEKRNLNNINERMKWRSGCEEGDSLKLIV